jgi:hypothetical protein
MPHFHDRARSRKSPALAFAGIEEFELFAGATVLCA